MNGNPAAQAIGERLLVAAPAPAPRWLGVRAFLRRKTAVIGAVLVAINALVAVSAPALGRWDPQRLDVKARLSAPSATHWFGTDDVGRDVWSRVIHGTRLSILVGSSVVLFSFAGGLAFGLLGGYYRALDNVLMRVMDGLMAFPGIILAIALMASLGPSVINVIVALGIVYVPRVARIVRGSVLVVRETPYVEAARALGIRDGRLLARHVLPNCLSPVIVQATFTFAASVLGEAAALSFLGVGVPPPQPAWGLMLSEARPTLMAGQWWLTVFPGLCILLVVLATQLFGDWLRVKIDPQQRNL